MLSHDVLTGVIFFYRPFNTSCHARSLFTAVALAVGIGPVYIRTSPFPPPSGSSFSTPLYLPVTIVRIV